MRVHFGPDNIKGFEQGVKAAFLHCLKNGNHGVDGAKTIKDKLGAGINFDQETRGGLVYTLNQFERQEDYLLKRALEIKDTFAGGMNLSAYPDCERAVVQTCLKMLTGPWRKTYVVKVKNQLGQAMRFSDETVPGYSAVVQKEFLEELRQGGVEDGQLIKDEFGAGVALDPENFEGYRPAVRDGFIHCVDTARPGLAKHLTDQFEKGAEIGDKKTIIQGKFIFWLREGEMEHAIQLKKEFPEMECDRERISAYDDAFRACLTAKLSRSPARDMSKSNRLCEALGAGVDILNVLKKLKEDEPEKFIAFAKRDHWKAVFGDAAFGQFLEALPKRTDEARNAFTHNAYDRTTAFLNLLCRTGNLSLDDEGFVLVTDFIRRFGLARSQNLYQCFCGLSKHQSGAPAQKWIAEAGFSGVDDLEARVKALRQKVYAEEPLIDLSGLSPIERELLAVVTGKAAHRFDSGRPRIETIISDFAKAHAAGEIAPLPEGYPVEAIETAEVSIDFDPALIQADHDALRREILKSIEQPENCDSLKTQSLRIIDEKSAFLESKGDAPFVTDQLSKLSALRGKVAEAEDLDELMVALLPTKFMGNKNPLYSVMRQIVFRKIFIRNRSPEAIADMVARLSAERITGQSVLEIIGIVDDTVKHHALNLGSGNQEKYWNDKTWSALRASRQDDRMADVLKMFSPHIGNLRDAARKFKFNETGKTATVRSIPDRGFVGEMSGYLADVCYTEEYPLLKPRPNLIPHKLVAGEGQEAEFFGSYLIFELEEDTGDKVMLVRGFNVPAEASIDILKFIETVFSGLEATARERGIKKIVIPGLMGALSNYPLTISYLYNRYVAGRQPIKLKEPFVFNNYDLTEQCFVVREIDESQPSKPKIDRPRRPQSPPLAATP